MLTQDDVKDIEGALLEKLEQIRKEKGSSSSDWGRMAFPEAGSPVTKMRNFRNGRKSILGVGDLIRLAQALGVDPSKLFASVLFDKKV